jgi:2-iminobutanoate/2-iminopropanoate deaminase
MRIRGRRDFFGKLAFLCGVASITATRASAQSLQFTASMKQFVKRDASQASGYSQAVITQNSGRTVWLAGHATATDASGKSLAGDFAGQVQAVFAFLDETLGKTGGKLSDMVTMTVFITDPANHKTFTRMRHDLLGDNFPASAVVTVSHLANPDLLLEIQGIAVIG